MKDNLNKNCKICSKYVSRFNAIDHENVECPHCKHKFNSKIDSEYLDNWIAAHAAYVEETMKKLKKCQVELNEKAKGIGIKCKIVMI